MVLEINMMDAGLLWRTGWFPCRLLLRNSAPFVDDANRCCKYYATLSLLLFGCNSVLLKISDEKVIDATGGRKEKI